MAHFEITARSYSVRIYDEHPDKYVASFQVNVDGTKGFVHSLCGSGFYRRFPAVCVSIFEMLGVTSIEFSVGPAHLRVMVAALKGIADIEIMSDIVVSGRKMFWAKMTLKGEQNDGE